MPTCIHVQRTAVIGLFISLFGRGLLKSNAHEMDLCSQEYKYTQPLYLVCDPLPHAILYTNNLK